MTPTECIDSIREMNLGDTCFIIGGGPSLLTCMPDKSVLEDRPIFNTNNAYRLFPNALVSHFADRAWWEWHLKEYPFVVKGFKTTCLQGGETRNHDMADKGVVIFGQGNRAGDISTEKHLLSGNNTGHQCINMAYLCGFKNIVLLGFDMKLEDKHNTHWHKDHKRPTNTTMYATTMVPGLGLLAKHQESLGFKVWNTNRDSGIRCFEFCDLEQFL